MKRTIMSSMLATRTVSEDGATRVQETWYHLITGHFGPVTEPEENVAIYGEEIRAEALFWFKNLGWTLTPNLQ